MSRKKAEVKKQRRAKEPKKNKVRKKDAESVRTAQLPESAPRGTQSSQASETAKSVDIVQVREHINSLVGVSAETIANKLIAAAKEGQLASARYLFEAVGLYPPTEETKPRPKEDTLAYTLLRRMGLPTEPLSDEDEVPTKLISNTEVRTREPEGIAEKKSSEDAVE